MDADQTADESIQGKRKRRNEDEWVKTKKRVARNSASARPPPKILCVHRNTSLCSAELLTEDDVKFFFDAIYANKTVNLQNNFLMPYVTPYSSAVQRPRTSNPRKRTPAQYIIRKENGDLVTVCAKTFMGITRFGQRRIHGLSKNFFENGTVKQETRGGSRRTEVQIRCSDSIVAFIRTLNVVESHYNRGSSTRQYLSSDLSVRKLYGIWKNKQETENQPISLYSTFENIFRTRFNLSFGSPKVDVCSFCVLKNKQIEDKIDVEVNEAELKLHKARAKRFYEILAQSRDDSDVLSIVFDMQKNAPLPKTNVTETYYSRQMWLYNLTVVIHSKKQSVKNVFIYSWLESQSGKGSNEIVSALAHFFNNIVRRRIRKRRIRHIHLFSDSCSAQNKNSSMISFLLSLASTPWIQRYINTMKFYFPVRGHSYLPPDRVFGRIEKEFRKCEVISSPEFYYKVFSKHGNVFLLGRDWNVYDYKTLSDQMFLKKNVLKLKMRSNRVWYFQVRKSSKEIGISEAFGGKPKYFNLFKANVNIKTRKPKMVPSLSHISEAKRKDVEKLLEFIKLTKAEREFYKRELGRRVVQKSKMERDMHPVAAK